MEDAVKEIVAKCVDIPRVDLRSDADLWDAGITSMQVVRIMMAVEDEFQVELPEEALTRANFATVQSITKVVREHSSETISTRETLA